MEWRNKLEAGEVFLNDERADWQRAVHPGQVLIWNRPPWVEEDTPQKYDLIYHDENLVIVDKPSGLPTLPGGGFYRNTLLSLVRADFPLARPLHRLGRGTSGLVIFALDTQTASRLHRLWPKVEKQYQALANFVAREDSYDIRVPIGHQEHERLGKVWAASPIGKPARSIARVLQRRLDSTVFEVDLHTGRPHQIRIHLACIGHPLIGDPLYASGGLPKIDRPGLPGDTGYSLHAKRLCFEHPVSGRRMELAAPLPSYW
jgi:23S rRNA pseudouridine1911/1915/1917 synthase